MSCGVFSSIPVLPVVIQPHPRESLSGWLSALANVYRVSLGTFVDGFGHTLVLRSEKGHYDRPPADRELTVFPPFGLLEALQVETGVGMETLRPMTLIGVE